MANFDFFSTSRMSTEVLTNYISDYMWRFEAAEIYRLACEDARKGLRALEAKRGSILLTDSEYFEQKAVLTADLEEQRKLYADYKDNYDNKFTGFTTEDRRFYKAYASAKSEAEQHDAIVRWLAKFMGVSRDASGLDFLAEKLMKRYGDDPGRGKVIVTSEGTRFTQERAQNAVLKLSYLTLAEEYVAVGVIKAARIPGVLRDKYAKKPSNKKRAKKQNKAQ